MKKHYLLTLILAIITINLSAQSSHLFGLTINGGGNGAGTIFRTDTNGLNYNLVDSFNIKSQGTRPGSQKLLEVGGKLYGVTRYGGDSLMGVLFEYDPSTGIYLVKHHFNNATGKFPNGYLILSSNGKIYGNTRNGGFFNLGTLFEYDITTTVLTKKQDFSSINGAYPIGQLVETSPGIIYGVTEKGGAHNEGLIYEYTVNTNTLLLKDDFKSTTNGEIPLGGLMKANNGKLYGTCSRGGDNVYGTLFEYDFVTDSINKIHDFDGLDGRTPSSSLIQASNGKLYGTTQSGGASARSGQGVLFEYNITSDSLKNLHNFVGSLSGSGVNPNGLVEGSAGKLLIYTLFGGLNLNSGTISEYVISTSTMTNKQSFDKYENGAYPNGSLVKYSTTGKYYGVCQVGGSGNNGVIFEFDDALDTIINKISLSSSPEGKLPTNSLIEASNGMLYGIAEAGGDGYGLIFEVDPNTYNVSIAAKFNKNTGGSPRGALVEEGGKIYGTTLFGGKENGGTIYSYDISTRNITKLADAFNSSINSLNGGLIKASNGKLYGTSRGGGISNVGTLYEYDIILDTLTVRDQFLITDGMSPESKLLQATNGKLYGTTRNGGQNNEGAIFEFDILADSIKLVASFNGTINGSYPDGGLIETNTGKFFGMTTRGNFSGGASEGVVYELDLTNDSIIPRANFNKSIHGYGGRGELLEASNGKLYATSTSSTTGSNGGFVVEFDPNSFSITATSQLSGITNGSLIEVVSLNSASIKEEEKHQSLLIYPNPTNYQLNIDTKGEKINTIKIYDMTGKLIISINTNIQTVDVSGIHNGTYIIQVSTDNGVAHSRFIKQ